MPVTEAQFLKKLEAVGVIKSSISELVNGPSDYEAALPIILDHVGGVRCDDPRRTRGSSYMLVRALGVPAAKRLPGLWDTLLPRFEAATDIEEKWAIGNTMQVAVGKSHLETVRSILSRRRLGKSREPFCRAARKIKCPELIPPLIAMLHEKRVGNKEDPRFPYEEQLTPADPIRALGYMAGPDVLPELKPFLTDCYPGSAIPDPLVRREARNAIDRIRSRSGR